MSRRSTYCVEPTQVALVSASSAAMDAWYQGWVVKQGQPNGWKGAATRGGLTPPPEMPGGSIKTWKRRWLIVRSSGLSYQDQDFNPSFVKEVDANDLMVSSGSLRGVIGKVEGHVLASGWHLQINAGTPSGRART
jgi:hypothetical protein